jgi:hypothetical protein
VIPTLYYCPWQRRLTGSTVSWSWLLACGLLFSFCGDLRAAGSSHPCASVTRDAERLACYDRHFGSPQEHPNGASSNHSGGDEPGSDKNSSIEAAITVVERRRDGLFVVTLDNGQVWSQSELDSRAEVRVGDTVSVRRGAFGSHLLITTAGIATRVKRVR